MERARNAALQREIDMLRQEIRVAREAAQLTADFVVRQFEQTERMLRRVQVANAERQAVLDAATQLSIIATDLDGTIRLFSKGAATLLGYRPAEMIDKRTVLSLHCSEDLVQYGEKLSGIVGADFQDMRVFDLLVKQKQSQAREWSYVRKDGTRLPVSLSVTSLHNPDGRVAGYLFAAMDMTLQKEMERALIEAKEAAEAANASKGDFLARMSHEIRTPMNGVIGMATLLEKTGLDVKQRSYVEKLIGSANTLLHLINDILDFSKIDAGHLRLEHVAFNLEDILGNIANVVGMQAEKKGLEFLFRIDPRVPNRLIGDPLRLSQILMNLAGNAVKFTEHGEIVVSAQVEDQNHNDLTVRFSVRDSGIGLQGDQVDALFSAFSQADDSITRKYGGTGLGLAICKQLTELMGGRIWVESEPGKGSEFIFTARLQCVERHDPARTMLFDQLVGLKALVVDDNSIARDVLSSMLRSLRIEVDTAVDGESALSLLEQATRDGEPYEVVLLDWMMPGIDGIETARRIRGNKDISRIPAMLMVTANAREDAYMEAKNAGLDAFLLKPVYASIMHDTLLDIIGVETQVKVSRIDEHRQQVDLGTRRGSRILLVDDNIINQEVAAEFLQSVGMEVTIAGNGREAIEILNRSSYALVLMDIQMPEMDGLEATRRIRRQERFRDLPIIAMTAHAMTGDRDKSLAAGMNDHITKPIDQKVLYQTLQRWIPAGERTGLSTPTVEQPAGDSVVMPELPGIDSDQAIRVLNGNTRLFRKMLHEFKHEYALLPTRLRELSETGSWSEIGVLAHTLKGVAGYIGAPDLGATARQLEDALKEGRRDEAGGLLIAFIDAVDAVLSALAALPPLVVSPQQPASRSENLDSEQQGELLRALIGQLERGEAGAEQGFTELREQLQVVGGEPLLQMIEQKIDDIEYEEAAAAARELLMLLEQQTE
ncbi:PAS domain-containing hybrid sensor histidine kinase/response regulator [Desulfofustis limnaeus]|jgi:two-component system sensor histidine kinase/response regulator|uniref:histidine kinase n=1 Tax=Desulfofustis limnaeus TaxID=2740163 RepID=A0ABM7W5T1_9BACT|nr:response regulator [Desulfofustis limnaeus]MDX9894615.1 response regulator [Desulfofustis sp.]BDD86240.1 hypothetical protein DPPLL_06050 [Desulfofustis limnaeus]